jgi:hypothetical protein
MNTSGRNAMVRSSFFQPSARQPKRACLTGNHNRQLARLLLGRWTIYRNGDVLLESGVLFEATSPRVQEPRLPRAEALLAQLTLDAGL